MPRTSLGKVKDGGSGEGASVWISQRSAVFVFAGWTTAALPPHADFSSGGDDAASGYGGAGGLGAAGCGGAQARPFTAKDMATLDRVGSPRISPDGHWLAYQVRSTDWAANKGVNAIWLLDLSQGDATPHKLGIGEGSAPRWAPDGRTLYFLSRRSKTSEVWRTDASGAAPVQVTASPVDVGAYRISPDGRTVVFAALAYPDCKTLNCSNDRHKARGENKAEGEVYDKLGVRFWDSFGDGRYQHLFAGPVSGGEAVTLQGDLASDTPSRPEGDESASPSRRMERA